MMKLNFLLLLTVSVISYYSLPQKKNIKFAKASIEVFTHKKQLSYIQDNEYTTYYVVVADTNQNYYILKNKLFALNKSLGIKIDTMDRTYNKKKNRIAYPDTYPNDEIYAGEYYPRRGLSESLSLEYLKEYKQRAKEKTIALITGIYRTKTNANFALQKLKTKERKAFVLRSKIFTDCMH